jgi:hypothetical protein
MRQLTAAEELEFQSALGHDPPGALRLRVRQPELDYEELKRKMGKHLSSLTPAELAVFALPPLTEAELAVLGPRHEYLISPKAPVRASRPDDPSHTCMDCSTRPSPACEAAEIE